MLVRGVHVNYNRRELRNVVDAQTSFALAVLHGVDVICAVGMFLVIHLHIIPILTKR